MWVFRPGAVNPAALSAKSLSVQPKWSATRSGHASSAGTPFPMAIESPIAAATTGDGVGVAVAGERGEDVAVADAAADGDCPVPEQPARVAARAAAVRSTVARRPPGE